MGGDQGRAVLEPISGLDTLRDDWAALAQAAGNIFLTPEWCETWWRHFGDGQLRLLACTAGDGRLAGIWPLYEQARRPLRIVRLIGHGPGDELGPVCVAADRPLLARALTAALDARELDCDLLLAERLPGEGWEALGGRTVQRESSPVLPISGRSWEEFLAGQSRNFREQAGRRARRLAREHSSSLCLVDTPAELERALDALFLLHALRWRDGGSAAFTAELQAFHRDFAQTALARGWLRLWLLEVDEQPVAAWYGFRYGAAESFYQAGRDPAWDAWSVGFVLLVQTMKAAFEDGLHEYRLLRGGEDYKSRFATEDLGLQTIVAAGSRIGKPAAALAARARMLPAPLRRRLTREP